VIFMAEATKTAVPEPTKKRKSARKGTTIPFWPGVAARDIAGDSYSTHFEAFRTSGKYIGYDQAYGGTINDEDRLLYSLREPVGHWWTQGIANDIWDNWFKIKDIAKPDDPSLDKDVQSALALLKAETQLPRETLFERRYGTAILLLSYTGFDNSWETPLFTPKNDKKLPKLNSSTDSSMDIPPIGGSTQLLQITPYPWTAVSNVVLDTNQSSLRYGLPEYYQLSVGSTSADLGTPPGGSISPASIRVHWTRVIHDAPRLDEHPYLGISAIDPLFDDLVGGRNARWGMYQGYFRHGQGFPKIQTKGTKAENEAWVTSGGLNDMLNARGYFVCGEGEDITFVGTQAQALNPSSYFDTYFTFIAAATGVATDTIKGVSAGRVTGSEVNERQYFKAITLQQRKKEPLLRELIDRLIQTGQVDFDGEYLVEWVDPFSVNPQDKAAIEFLEERTNALRMQSEYIDEVRKRKGMKPLPDGEGAMLMPQPGQFGGIPTQGGAPNQQAPERQPTEPETPTSADLLFEEALRDAKKQ